MYLKRLAMGINDTIDIDEFTLLPAHDPKITVQNYFKANKLTCHEKIDILRHVIERSSDTEKQSIRSNVIHPLFSRQYDPYTVAKTLNDIYKRHLNDTIG